MKFIVQDNSLVLKLQRSEQFFGFKRRLVIPRENITSLEWHGLYTFTDRIWRAWGTGMPGLLYAGHFRGGGERYFLYLHKPHGVSWVQGSIVSQNTLVITTHDYPYKQVLVTCPPDKGIELVSWWRGTSFPTSPSASE